MTPSKIRAIPIAETKKPTMRVIASIPLAPNLWGVQIDAPEHSVRLRLPKNATSLDLLRAVYRHPRLPLEVRIEAAGMALPYEHPRLVMIAPASTEARTIRIVGGLPRLPGTETIMPGDKPPVF
jgi:hypothetical protein